MERASAQTGGKRLRRIVSGGQTGVDRGALRAGRAVGLEIGGWCPPGRASETGTIPGDLPLRETPAERSPSAPGVPRSLRSEWNVRDSDATLILRPPGCHDAGTQWSADCARSAGQPLISLDPHDARCADEIAAWLASATTDIRILNVAGPPESSCPGIEARTYAVLKAALRRPSEA
jgi:hypothetical protein